MIPTPSAILRHAAVPALLVSNVTNIHYLTGMRCSEGYALITPRSIILLVDGRYTETARHEVYASVGVRDRNALAALLQKHPIIGIESDYVTIQQKAHFKRIYKNTKFVHTVNAIEYFRRTKQPKELALLRRADRITQEMLRRVPDALTPGLREAQLAWMLRTWAHELGAEDLSFDSIVAFGPNTARPHHHPGARRLRARDIVLVDCGARYHGYCGDRTEMFFVGKPTAAQCNALEAVRKAKDAAIGMVKERASTRVIDRTARAVLREYGMEDAFTHALGHGVGLEIHEGVSLSQRGKDEVLCKNEVITIEPGVYFPGKFGIRLEEMIIV